MNIFWPYVRDEINHVYMSPEEFDAFVEKQQYKYSLHTMIYTSVTLPKRIELGDAIETNAYHLFIYMENVFSRIILRLRF